LFAIGFFGLGGTAGAHGQDVAGAIDAGDLMMLHRMCSSIATIQEAIMMPILIILI